MDPEDFPSDSDESDEDFKPDKVDSHSASEIDSDNVDNDQEAEKSSKSKKRKKASTKSGKKKQKAVVVEKDTHSDDEQKQDENDEEAEKRRTDALWADFLGGAESVLPKKEEPIAAVPKITPTNNKKAIIPVKKKEDILPEVQTITKIFEYAGEEVEVTVKAPIPVKEINQVKAISASSSATSGKAKSGGLGSVLSQLGKKSKLSTLEKTKLDWNNFKQKEGLEEDLETHNKGKDGFLDRQDFLQRTDVRQFEIEKSFRQTKRSNR